MSKLEVLHPTCNPITIRDGRGGIFTWCPPDQIVEFNLIYTSAGTVRGLHYHPEFIEYLLIVDGSGALISSEDDNLPEGDDCTTLLSKGTCLRIPSDVRHAVYAITHLTTIALLTRRWDDCEVPAVRVQELPSGIPATTRP
jgi:dTDP-4-dehydrorhamnose 3,5-epimerase-like enzyme